MAIDDSLLLADNPVAFSDADREEELWCLPEYQEDIHDYLREAELRFLPKVGTISSCSTHRPLPARPAIHQPVGSLVALLSTSQSTPAHQPCYPPTCRLTSRPAIYQPLSTLHPPALLSASLSPCYPPTCRRPTHPAIHRPLSTPYPPALLSSTHHRLPSPAAHQPPAAIPE